MGTNKLPLAAFIGCAAIWGSTFLVIRFSNDSLPPLEGCAIRLIVASLMLGAILMVQRKSLPKGEALKAAIWFGVLEFGISMGLLYVAERTISSGLAAVLYATCPLSAMVGAHVLGMEKLTVQRVVTALAALLGVAIIFWKEVQAGGVWFGLAIDFIAAISAAFAGLMLQRGPKQDAIGSNCVGSLVGGVLVAVASLVMHESLVVPTSLSQIWPIAYLVVMGSGGAFVMFAWLLNHWSTSRAAFIGVVVPVIAVILGSLVRHEALQPGSFIGGAIVIGAVIFALRAENRSTALEPV